MLDFLRSLIGGKDNRTNTGRSIAWNYVGYLSQTAINFGLTSIIVRHLAVAEYGLFTFIVSLSANLYLLDMGMSYTLVQAYVKSARDPGKLNLNGLISTAFWTLAALGFIGVLVFSLIGLALPGPFNIPHQYLREASLVFILASLVIQAALPGIALTHLYEAANRFDRISQIQLVTSMLNLLMSGIVLMAGFGLVGLAIVQAAVSIVQLALLVLAVPASIPLARVRLKQFNWHLLKPLLRPSGWGFLTNLSMYFFDIFTWVALGTFCSMKETAIFGLASKLPNLIWKLADNGANVSLPLLSESSAMKDTDRIREIYLNTLKLVVGASLPFLILGSFFARPLIQVWVGNEYTGAAPAMQWLLLSALAYCIGYPSDQLLYARGMVKKAAIISVSTSLISVCGVLLLISRYGAVGLAAVIAIIQILMTCAWLTPLACRLSHTSFLELFKCTFSGLKWPLLALAVQICIICSTASLMRPLWVISAATVSGAVYFILWGFGTVLPILRNQTGLIA